MENSENNNLRGSSNDVYGKIVVIKRSGQDSASFELIDDSYTFGRGVDCDIRIQLLSIADQHCKIGRNELGQAILVKLNNEAVAVNNSNLVEEIKILNHNDIITIVERSFRYEYTAEMLARAQLTALQNFNGGTFPMTMETPKKPSSLSGNVFSVSELPSSPATPKTPIPIQNRPSVISNSIVSGGSNGQSPKMAPSPMGSAMVDNEITTSPKLSPKVFLIDREGLSVTPFNLFGAGGVGIASALGTEVVSSTDKFDAIENTVSVSENENLIGENHVAVVEEGFDVIAQENVVTIVEETVTVTEETVTVIEDTMIYVEEDVTVNEETVTVVEEAMTFVEEIVTVVEETATVVEETMAVLVETANITEECFEVSQAIEVADISQGVISEISVVSKSFEKSNATEDYEVKSTEITTGNVIMETDPIATIDDIKVECFPVNEEVEGFKFISEAIEDSETFYANDETEPNNENYSTEPEIPIIETNTSIAVENCVEKISETSDNVTPKLIDFEKFISVTEIMDEIIVNSEKTNQEIIEMVRSTINSSESFVNAYDSETECKTETEIEAKAEVFNDESTLENASKHDLTELFDVIINADKNAETDTKESIKCADIDVSLNDATEEVSVSVVTEISSESMFTKNMDIDIIESIATVDTVQISVEDSSVAVKEYETINEEVECVGSVEILDVNFTGLADGESLAENNNIIENVDAVIEPIVEFVEESVEEEFSSNILSNSVDESIKVPSNIIPDDNEEDDEEEVSAIKIETTETEIETEPQIEITMNKENKSEDLEVSVVEMPAEDEEIVEVEIETLSNSTPNHKSDCQAEEISSTSNGAVAELEIAADSTPGPIRKSTRVHVAPSALESVKKQLANSPGVVDETDELISHSPETVTNPSNRKRNLRSTGRQVKSRVIKNEPGSPKSRSQKRSFKEQDDQEAEIDLSLALESSNENENKNENITTTTPGNDKNTPVRRSTRSRVIQK